MQQTVESTGSHGPLAAELRPDEAPAVSVRGRSRWFVPDLALLASVVTLFYCLFLYDSGRKLFRDSDTGWHVRIGESMLAERALPRADPYSFTRNGHPWFAWEWGADLLMGAAHRADGLRGVALLYLVAIAAATWLWFRLHWAAGGSFLLACLMASPMLSTVNLHWLARPHVFGWLFLLATIWRAEKAPEKFRARHAVVAFLGSALWANLHASFFLAPLGGLIYAAGHLVRPLVWNLEKGQEWRKSRWFLAFAISACLGSLLNPYGWRLHAHVARYLGDKELLARIGEFQSFDFHADGAWQILLGLGLAMAGAVLALGQQKLPQFLVTAVLVGLALRSARILPLVALVALPLANGAITEALEQWRGLRPALRRRLDGFLRYSANLRALDARFRGAALIPLFVLLTLGYLRLPGVSSRIGFPPDEFPVEASAAVERLDPDARLLATDKFGGYLIYRFAGNRRVFFDGRSDFYGSDYMKSYIRLIEIRPDWRQLLEAHGFTHALLPNDYSLLAALEGAGWKRLYRDRVATLLQNGKTGN